MGGVVFKANALKTKNTIKSLLNLYIGNRKTFKKRVMLVEELNKKVALVLKGLLKNEKSE